MSIETALFTRLSTASLGATYEFSWPGVLFEPPETGKYIEVSVLKNVTDQYSFTAGGPDHQQGLLQANVIWPLNQGIIGANAVADLIIAHFPKGLNLDEVKISGTGYRTSAIPDEHRLIIPVSIPWSF